ncbi:MAG: S8 family serine peptidase [Anaerolineae bacterium]
MPTRLLQSRRFLLGLSGLSLVLALGGAGAFARLSSRATDTTPQPTAFAAERGFPLTPASSLAEVAERFPELAEVLRDPALDSVYKDFLVAYQTGGPAAARDLASQRGLLNDRDQIRLTLVLDAADAAPAVAAELAAAGVIVEGYYEDLVDIAVPLALVESLADADSAAPLFARLGQLDHVIKLRLPLAAQAGEVLSAPEGVESTGAAAWHRAGYTGAGVKVGILDLGFDGYRDLLGDELPAQVTARSFVLNREPDESGLVHGTACAEIVHAMAPDAELYLAYYDGSEVAMGRAVEWMLEQGVDIISHSATGLVGPMNGTGYQCDLVDKATAQGVLWVNCMGNYGLSHYRGAFTDSDGNGLHEFAAGAELLAFLPPQSGILVALNWDDWEEVAQDFDLYLYDADGTLLASSLNSQSGRQGDMPFEGIRFNQVPEGTYYLAIEAAAATREVTFDLYVLDGQVEFASPAYSLGTPADSASVVSVGASNWRSGRLEDFSSQGPTSDGRMKPDLVAPDAVTVAAYAPEPFYGTSASTPHVAGAAALLLSAYPNLTREILAETLMGNAADLGQAGPDTTYGYGQLRLPDPRTSYTATTPTALAALPRTPAATSAWVPSAVVTPLPLAAPITNEDTRLLALALLLTMCIGTLGLIAAAVLLLMLTRSRRAAPPMVEPMRFAEPPERAHLLAHDGAEHLLLPGENAIGRSAQNAIVLADNELVSRHHAAISWDGQSAVLVDLGSSNGTYVNGQRLAPRTPRPLSDGDVVDIGPQVRFIVRLPWQEGHAAPG